MRAQDCHLPCGDLQGRLHCFARLQIAIKRRGQHNVKVFLKLGSSYLPVASSTQSSGRAS